MMEQKKRIPAWSNKSFPELSGLCSNGWKSLSQIDKQRYEEMKLNANLQDAGAISGERKKGEVRIRGGYDSLGNPLEEIQRRDLHRKQEALMKIRMVDTELEEALHADRLEIKQFNVLVTNVFVKIDEDQIYVPAEISIAKFSLNSGVISVFQAFPEAGVLPRGYKRQCLENSEKGHKIPLEENDMIPMDCQIEEKVDFRITSDAEIMSNVKCFLQDADVIYCMPEMMRQSEGVFRTISNRSNVVMPSITFLPLPELLFGLANRSEVGAVLPSASVAERELESERYLYKPGLSCPWHEAMTDTNCCSSAIAWRLSFTIMDICCQHYGIPLVPGKHVPKSAETDTEGKEWAFPESRVGVPSRNAVIRKPGDFNAVDVRFKVDNQNVNSNAKDVMDKNANKQPNGVMPEENVFHHTAGTITDYLDGAVESVGNLSVSSRCSSDEEYISMDTISQASVESSVNRTGIGRGAIMRNRRGFRLAATFPGQPRN